MKPTLASLLTICLLAACTNVPLTPATPDPVIVIYPTPTATFIPSQIPERFFPFRAGLVASAQSVLPDMSDASTYRIEFIVQEDLVHIQGHEEVSYTNRETAPLTEIQFRLFPNLLGGKMEVSKVLVNESSVTPSYGLANSLMIVPLETPLAVGQSTHIAMDFTLEVPTDVELNYGVLAYYDNVLTLAHAYPVIPVYDASGWNAEIPPQSGDLTFNDMAFYLVTVTAPEGLTVVASGAESAPVTRDRQNVWTVAAGPARDFFVAASRDFDVTSETVGEVTVNSYAPQSLKSQSRDMLATGVQSLKIFEELYGPYPYTEFDIVATPTLALGVEYPGITAIAARILQGEYGSDTAIYLESTVAHETAHQWFYNLVGNDQLDQPWLDESLAQFATWQYYQRSYGPAAAGGFEASLHSRWQRVNNAPIPIGMPVASYAGNEYGAIVYGRGAFFLDALETQMGPSTFDAFLRDYVATYSWEIATTDGFKSLAEKHCSCNLTPLFEEWVY